MMGQTHCAAALLAVSAVALRDANLPSLGAQTLVACATATIVGGWAPDLDKPGSVLWRKVPGGGILAPVVKHVFAGGHRHLSHSLLGLVLLSGAFDMGLRAFLPANVVCAPVHSCFVIAYFSHLVADCLTEDGVPWLFPLGGRYGFPPVRRWRLKTGGWFERAVVLPLLWGALAGVWWGRLPQALAFLKSMALLGGSGGNSGAP